MKIVLLSPLVSDSDYAIMQKKIKISNPSQKFYSLLYKGLRKNDVEVTVISLVSSFYQGYLQDDQFHYFYKPNGKMKLSFMKDFRSEISKYIDEDTVIIADAQSYWTVAAALKQKCKVVTLITDFPHHVASYSSSMVGKNKLFKKLYNQYALSKMKTIKKSDAFILLTEYMTDEVGKEKPYVVIEGFTDSDISLICEKVLNDSDNNITISYLGALNDKSGIITLIKAIQLIQDNRIVLNIYGDGNLVEQITAISDTRIHYLGVATLEEVEQIEMNSDFLINPRPSQNSYNRYSFPSKTLEYMISGTPVITTRLEGIPHEYDQYLFFLDDLNPEIMAKNLSSLLSKDKNELLSVGKNAQIFAHLKKNNVVQTKKIIDFFKEILESE